MAGRSLGVAALLLLAITAALAPPTLGLQSGDVAGEAQPPLPADLVVPLAPVLSAVDELRTLRVSPDLRIDLVASEPLVRDPVAMCFDARGRLWVVEMSGYMPDVDGKGEREPAGSIAVLEDSDGDGRIDRRTVFLDGLVLPRAIAVARGGVLVIAPPELLFCSDTDGDDRADERIVVDRGLEGIHSPEHAINALLPTIDNAFHCAKSTWRYAFRNGAWKRERTAGGGQWGASKDDEGRIFTNDNSDPLRADLIASTYAARNPNLGPAAGVLARVVEDRSPRPARMTPGVNRGYQQGFLDASWRISAVTAACAPWILRGGALGDEHRGDAFVCDPSANLVLRYDLREDAAGAIRGTPVRSGPGGLDFLTSTDERFRPVFLCDGPDGALYVADMYRGVIQHRLFVTSFLRKQVLERGLEKPIGMGRIWRVTRAKRETVDARRDPDRDDTKAPRLSDAEPEDLVAALSHPDGWVRDTAQRLLVEDDGLSSETRALLRETAAPAPGSSATSWLGRLHALWTLDGIGGIDEETALRALADPDPRVRNAAVRTSEPLAGASAKVRERWLALARSSEARMRRQVLLSLGSVASAAGPDALLALLAEGAEAAEGPEMRSAALSGLCGRELECLESALAIATWADENAGRAAFLSGLARCVAREGRADRIERLIARLASDPPPRAWQITAACEGMLAGRGKDALGKSARLRLAREPAALDRLLAIAGEKAGENVGSGADEKLAARARELADALAWPGKPGVEELRIRLLDPDEQAQFEKGRELYATLCAQCHLGSGFGDAGSAPPLRGSSIALGPPGRFARALLHGLRGEVEVEGARWYGEMPGVSASDEDVAAILTYVRREWGHGADPVAPATIGVARKASADRTHPWTLAELSRIED